MKTLITITGICSALVFSAMAADDDAAPKRPGGKGAPDGKGGKGMNPEQIFEHLDSDKSGGISLEEFKAGPRAKDADPAMLEKRFGNMAGDDGIISQPEFTAAMKKMAEARGGKGGPKGGPKGKGGKKGAPDSSN